MDVRTDFKPEPAPKRAPKRLKRGDGFRRNPTLAAQFRFAVLHEFGGRCVMNRIQVRTEPECPARDVPAAGEASGSPAVAPKAAIPEANAAAAGRGSVCFGPLDPCHAIPKAYLRDHGFPEEVVYDPRNGVAACRRHHANSDSGLERFPRELLPPSVEEFAKAHGLSYLLDKLYERSAG